MAGVGDLLAKEPLSHSGAQSVFPLNPWILTQRGGAVVDCRHHPHQGSSQPSRRQRPNTPKPKRVFEVARRCDEETVSRNIFSATQKISTKTGGSKIQMDLGTRGQTGPRIPGARINFINDKIIIRRVATLVSGPAARTPS